MVSEVDISSLNKVWSEQPDYDYDTHEPYTEKKNRTTERLRYRNVFCHKWWMVCLNSKGNPILLRNREWRSIKSSNKWLRNCLKKCPSWGYVCRSASEEIPCLLWKLKIHYRFQRSTSLDPTLGQWIHIFKSVHIILPFMPRSSK
jgi:hypothetical protein